VLGVVGNQVRFGIEAPRHITIDRAEIHERKKRAAMAGGNAPGREGEDHLNGNVQAPDGGHPNGNIATLKLRRP
jgi:hypothetical protein